MSWNLMRRELKGAGGRRAVADHRGGLKNLMRRELKDYVRLPEGGREVHIESHEERIESTC